MMTYSEIKSELETNGPSIFLVESALILNEYTLATRLCDSIIELDVVGVQKVNLKALYADGTGYESGTVTLYMLNENVGIIRNVEGSPWFESTYEDGGLFYFPHMKQLLL